MYFVIKYKGFYVCDERDNEYLYTKKQHLAWKYSDYETADNEAKTRKNHHVVIVNRSRKPKYAIWITPTEAGRKCLAQWQNGWWSMHTLVSTECGYYRGYSYMRCVLFSSRAKAETYATRLLGVSGLAEYTIQQIPHDTKWGIRWVTKYGDGRWREIFNSLAEAEKYFFNCGLNDLGHPSEHWEIWPYTA